MASDKWWWPTWCRRQGHARGRYAPRLWPVWLVTPIWVAAAIALAVVIYLQLQAVAVPRPGPNGGPAVIDPLDVIKTTITVAGFVGAILVGVYGYRKQRLVEGDAHRADAEQLAQRYTTAAGQLGHEKAAVRLAGVYAMARLADDWADQRQVCLDVLCAYLRMPYEPDTASEKHREREVRHTIIRLIRDHLQDPSAPATWCGRDLDFTNATFDGGDFTGAKFTGGKVSFGGAKFGGMVSFGGAEFTGSEVSFDRAVFTGGTISFTGAKFADGTVSFFSAEFAGGEISFCHVKFFGGDLSFFKTKFISSLVVFKSTRFTGGVITFSRPNSSAAMSSSAVRSSLAVKPPSTTRNSAVAASHGVHSSLRQHGLSYKKWSGDRTNRPCNSVTFSVFGLGSYAHRDTNDAVISVALLQ